MPAVARDTEVVRTKLALLRLAEQLGSVAEACRVMGYSRGTFYRLRSRFQADGEAGLHRREREAVPPANRVSEELERIIVDLAIAHPEWGRRRVVEHLTALGLALSPSGVRNVWKRFGLLTARARARAAKQRSSTTEAVRSS
jgi:transposase